MKIPDKGSRPRVTFDEETIAEHDKERGTRMMIPDPDTPFLRSPIMSSDDESEPTPPRRVSNPAVCNIRNYINNVPQAMLAQAIEINEQIQYDEKRKHEEFAKKRKAHYNEFRVIKGTDPKSDIDDALPQ